MPPQACSFRPSLACGSARRCSCHRSRLEAQTSILCGYLGDELIAAPIAALYDWVGANPAPGATGEPFDCQVLEIAVTNRVATATVRETDSHGTVIDHFHLLKVSERWWIVSKLWDAEP